MGVLAMLELDGDTAALLAAFDRVSLPRPSGLELRLVAATDSGVVLFQLWDSAEARQRHADDPAHHAALEAAGVFEHVTARRSRTFEHAELKTL